MFVGAEPEPCWVSAGNGIQVWFQKCPDRVSIEYYSSDPHDGHCAVTVVIEPDLIAALRAGRGSKALYAVALAVIDEVARRRSGAP